MKSIKEKVKENLEQNEDEILCVYDRYAGFVDGANYVLEEIEKIINHPLRFVNADKTVEDGMIEEISKLVEQLKK